MVSGTLNISGTAADSSGVSECDLLVDNLPAGIQTGTFNFSWDSRNVANGQHTLVVSCSDVASNTGQTSVAVSVNNAVVADTQAPVVLISSPAANSNVSGQVNISVSATDDVGVSQVSIYIDGVQVSSSSSASLRYTWNTKKSSAGVHTITGRAWDRAGNSGAASITVTR
jgi:hypothetical protein